MANIKNLCVTGLGELLWDFFPDGKKPGGAPANFVFHAQNLGAIGSVVSAVGNDFLGNEIVDYFKLLGLETGNVQVDPQKQTGIVEVKLKTGIPEYKIEKDVAWDFIKWTPQLASLAGESDAVCFGTLAQRSEITRQTILKFLKTTKPDCLRVFDINLRQNFYDKKIIADSLEISSVLKLNDEEFPVLAKLFSLKGSEHCILEKLMEQFGLTLVALTKGEKGSLLKTKTEMSFLEAPKVKVVDTVGAGDSFTAALIISKLCGKSFNEMHTFANEVAAYVCTQKGATPQLPDYISVRLKH